MIKIVSPVNTSDMVLQDIWLLVKKIAVGIFLFSIPVGIVFGLLWIIRFFLK